MLCFCCVHHPNPILSSLRAHSFSSKVLIICSINFNFTGLKNPQLPLQLWKMVQPFVPCDFFLPFSFFCFLSSCPHKYEVTKVSTLFFKPLFKSGLLSPLPTNHTLSQAFGYSGCCLFTTGWPLSCLSIFALVMLYFYCSKFWDCIVLQVFSSQYLHTQCNGLGAWDMAEEIQVETKRCLLQSPLLPQDCPCSPRLTHERAPGEKWAVSFGTSLRPLSTEEFSSRPQQAAPTSMEDELSPQYSSGYPKEHQLAQTAPQPQPPLNMGRGRPKVTTSDWGYFKIYTFHSYLLQLSFQ